jgi:Cu(I)/Ag(I) efflux system membrane fusion protein
MMSRFAWKVAVLGAALAAGAGGYWAGVRGIGAARFGNGAAGTGFETEATRAEARNGEKAEKRILYYRHPMGLPETSPIPRKDSMGMDFMPVYAGEETDDRSIKLSPGKLQRTGVRSETVRKQVISRPLRVPGTVQLDERRVSVVATRSEAFIDHVENVTTGDRVRKGQVLLHLYSPAIVAAAAQFVSNPGFEGARRRLENLNVPDEYIVAIERSHKVPLSLGWSAPRDGVILERNAVEGMKAEAGDVLFRIADLTTVWVVADVPEYEIARIRPDAEAEIRVRGFPGRHIRGRIGLVYPQVASSTRTVRVRIELANPDEVLRPDMYTDIEIATGSPEAVVVVPDQAVIDTGTRKLVILDKGAGRFEPRQVATGARGSGLVEIIEGIAPGEKVVVAANFLIDAESNLKAALGALGAAEQQP